MSANLFETGAGQVIIARFKASGEAEIGVFLVDLYCLGVKDAYFTRLWADEYEKRLVAPLAEKGGGKASLSPACARKLIEDVVAWTRQLGLEPHPDYKKGARVFGGIDPKACAQTFVFGKDGKPLYIRGPHDSEAFVEHVMGTLTRRLGRDGFHYIVAVGGSPGGFGDDAEEEAELEVEREGESASAQTLEEPPATPPKA